jgi:hypothetical protein
VGLTAVFYPGFVVAIVSLIDVLEWIQWSHEEYDFSTLLSGLCLWLVIGVPATYLGGCLGMAFQDDGFVTLRKNKVRRSVKSNSDKPWYL